MKCFTVRGKTVSPGITLNRDPFPRIECGNNGRGRKLGYVGLKVADFDSSLKKLDRCSVRKTEKGYWQLIKELSEDLENILVLVAIPGGFRGASYLVSSEFILVPCVRRGDHCPSPCPHCGLKFESPHPDQGESKEYLPLCHGEKIVQLAAGYDAEGAAGRMGGPHDERILVLAPGARFQAIRSGRLYGESSVIHVRYDGPESGLMVGTREQVYPEEYTS